MNIRLGTCYFLSREHAIRYYASYGSDVAEVDRKIAEREIVVDGAKLPPMLPGDEIYNDADGRRWIVTPAWLTEVGPQNLDCQPAGELQAFADRIRLLDDTGVEAARRFPGKKGAAVVLGKYGIYAASKARAMRHRIDGTINQALLCEQICEEIYNSLPKWARW